MVTRDDMLAIWGSGNLRVYSAQEVEGLGIPSPAKDFLMTIGLPVQSTLASESFGIQFAVDKTISLCTLAEYARNHDMAESEMLKHFVRIGTAYETHLCIDEDGFVVRITLEDLTPDAINTSLETFMQFLCLLEMNMGRGATLSGTDAGNALSEIEREMRQIDDFAINNPEKWWSVVLEEMKHGLI